MCPARQATIVTRMIYQLKDATAMTTNRSNELQPLFGTRTNKACSDLIPSISCWGRLER